MSRKIFDVVVPLGKVHELTEQAIESALSQSCVNCVFVVVNGKYPGQEILNLRERFADNIKCESLKIIVDFSLQNANQARNLGISSAQSDWVAFLDSDDQWAEGWLECVMGEINKEPGAEMFYSSTVGRSKKGIKKVKLATDWKKFQTPEHYVTSGGSAQSSGFVVKRRLLDSLRWRHDVSRRQDWLFFIDAVRAGLNLKPIEGAYVIKGRDPAARSYESSDILIFVSALVGKVPFSVFLRHAARLVRTSRRKPLMILQIATLVFSVRHIQWYLSSRPRA